MEFEASMSNVGALSGTTGKDLKQLEKAARDAGAATSKSAKDAADALGYMALAGYDNKQMLEALMPVLRLSEAGNLDLARTSDLVTDSLSALGRTTKDLPVYLDQVAKTAASSNTNIDALMEATIVCGGTIRNLNVPLDEANALLGTLANRGIKGSEAGNSFNSILINLTSGAGQAGTAMEKLGLSAFDSNGKFKGVAKTLLELKDKTKNMTDEQRNMYLSMIGGKTQITTLQALLSGVGEEYGDLKDKVINSNGALEKMAKTMQDNNKGSITQLKSALEELGLKIYDVLNPSIAKLTDWLQKITDKLNSLSPEQQKLIVKFAMIAASVGPVLFIIGKLTTTIGKTIKKFADITKKIKEAGGVMKLILSPGGKVVLVITAIALVAILLIKNWEKVTKTLKAFKKTLQDNEREIKIVAGILTTLFGPALVKIAAQAAIAGTKIAINLVANIVKTGIQAVIAAAKLTGSFIIALIRTSTQIYATAAAIAINLLTAIGSMIIQLGRATVTLIINTAAWLTNKIQIIASTASLLAQKIAIVASTIATGAATTATWLFNAALSANPIGVVIIALAALGTAIYEVVKHWKEICAWIEKAWKWLTTWNGTKAEDKEATFTTNKVTNNVSNGKTGKNALGTSYWHGGRTLVGEHGPEIVDLPGGSRVIDHRNSMKMGGSIVIEKLADTLVVREEADIDRIAKELARQFKIEVMNMG